MRDSEQPAPPTPSNLQHKHFMTLGGGMGLPQKKLSIGQGSLSPSTLSSSFSISRQPTTISHLPDIYTTCPELRKFKTFMILPPNNNSNNDDSNVIKIKDPIKPHPQPPQNQSILQQPPQQQVPQQPTPQQPQMQTQIQPPIQAQPPNTSPISRPFIPNASTPIIFPFQRCPFPFQPFPVFQIFDPNAPVIRPHELGFVPKSEWPPQVFSLWDLRQMYFTRRNGAGRRFDFKLYNALLITKVFPPAYNFIGAMWVGPTLMKINSQTFAQLLGIHAVQGGLFHKQGNFSRHGFQQVQKQSQQAIQLNIDLRDVDDYNVRLFTDQYNRFSRDTEFVITDSLPTPNDEDEEEEAPATN